MKKVSHPDPNIRIGTYRCGATNVELYGLVGSRGGEFHTAPDRARLPCLKVGFDHRYWWEICAVLTHEAFEFLAACRGVRFVPCADGLNGSDRYQFIFNHNDFSQLTADLGHFLAQCLPDLSTQWNRHLRTLNRRRKT